MLSTYVLQILMQNYLIMGPSGDICNGKQIKIIGFKCNGI